MKKDEQKKATQEGKKLLLLMKNNKFSVICCVALAVFFVCMLLQKEYSIGFIEFAAFIKINREWVLTGIIVPALLCAIPILLQQHKRIRIGCVVSFFLLLIFVGVLIPTITEGKFRTMLENDQSLPNISVMNFGAGRQVLWEELKLREEEYSHISLLHFEDNICAFVNNDKEKIYEIVQIVSRERIDPDEYLEVLVSGKNNKKEIGGVKCYTFDKKGDQLKSITTYDFHNNCTSTIEYVDERPVWYYTIFGNGEVSCQGESKTIFDEDFSILGEKIGNSWLEDFHFIIDASLEELENRMNSLQ